MPRKKIIPQPDLFEIHEQTPKTDLSPAALVPLFVRRMIGSGKGFRKKTIELPTWTQIEDAIKSLNGKTRTDLIVEPEERMPYCIVAGGNHEKYTVFAAIKLADSDEVQYFALCDPMKRQQEDFEMILGGEVGEYPGEICVDQASALTAAQTFTQFGRLESSFQWTEDF